MDRGRRHLLALLLLLLCGVLLSTSERGRTVTADEPLHLIRGHVWLWTHDARLSYAHPPLANVLTSLPQLGKGDEPWGPDRNLVGELDPEGETLSKMKRTGIVRAPEDATRAEAIETLWLWEVANPLRVSQQYFVHDFQRARAELITGRRVMMAITLGFGLFFYLWIDRRYGWPTAILSLALYTLHPTLLAHGRLVTTDVPAMATVFLSLAATVAWIERPGALRVLWFLLATTAMVLTKHSGLVFVLVMSGIILLAAWRGAGGFAEAGGRGRRVAAAAGALLVVATLMTLAIDAAHFFDRVGLSVAEIIAEPEPQNWLYRRYRHQLVERSFLAYLPDPLRLPFPYTWLVGLATVSKQNASGHGGYFFGLNDYASHPLYFPVMLVLKTPLGLLTLLGLSLGLFVQRWRGGQRPSLATTVLLLFAAVNLISLIASHINIGVRHALTLLPIMILFAGRGGALLLAQVAGASAWRRWLGAGLVAACLGSGLFAVVAGFPHYLGYFNGLSGGPGGGRWVSVVGEDWGQDLDDVAEVVHAHDWAQVAYFTQFPLRHEELEAQGLAVERLGCSSPPAEAMPVIIHVTDWVRRTKCFHWLEGQEPVAFVNYNVLVFAPEASADEADDDAGDEAKPERGSDESGT